MASETQIPLVDLGAQHRQIAAEVTVGFARVMGNTSFILGKDVKDFEDAFARFCGVPHVIGVGNGTDALELSLRAVGIGPGDEVLVPVNSFIASALAIARAGATPVFVDAEPATQLIDVENAAARITARTRAIMPVHLFGQLAPMEAVGNLSADRNLVVIEDAAQAQGAKHRGKSAGSFGLVAGTSFYPGKNLGGYGDGGAVLTSAPELDKKVRALRNYGSETKYHHPETGFNSRLDTLQAVVLLAKLQRLDTWNAARRAAARRYDELLAQLPAVTLPQTLPDNEHVFHLYVVRVPERDRVLARLNAEGIGAGIHYPLPMHLQGAFRHLGHKAGDFPVAEQAAKEILSLPMFAEITPEQQARVADALGRALA